MSSLPSSVEQIAAQRPLTSSKARFQRVPALRRQLDRQYDALVADLDATLHPYRDRLPSYTRLPAQGRDSRRSSWPR
jgi:hypothetical protein